ncbi:MAG TPA: hypothetical protein VFT64_01980 [Rickettsiales bacterium]|nr:hypothetical protein [Rickettsiales bacterium]
MKIINRNTVNLLFDKAEALGQEPHESWRCVYLKFSDKPERNNQSLYSNFIVKPIISLMEDMGGFVYLCEDGDIFILFQGVMKPVMVKLSSHFADIDADEKVKNDKLYRVFDLGKHWQGFYSLCEAKYLDNLVAEEEQHYTYQAPANKTFAARTLTRA